MTSASIRNKKASYKTFLHQEINEKTYGGRGLNWLETKEPRNPLQKE